MYEVHGFLVGGVALSITRRNSLGCHCQTGKKCRGILTIQEGCGFLPRRGEDCS